MGFGVGRAGIAAAEAFLVAVWMVTEWGFSQQGFPSEMGPCSGRKSGIMERPLVSAEANEELCYVKASQISQCVLHVALLVNRHLALNI